MVVEGDDAPVEVDFTPKELLQYKLPHIDLFAPDKPKSQSKEKNIVRKNIRILEDTSRVSILMSRLSGLKLDRQ